ncbi:GntR family transcriptional regulator (plasmid) [Macrococcoides canis]|uniref:GntR family transcriptional regulator n=1 Tax=Macrococcoides canis TaxID=1855823 RepID=UPI0013E9864C|nr:GntR family transcriptional regulator [Macrococcus canis]QIH77048.1 GntR family transcriptional regulator [Macrococcus canis]
MKKINYLNNVPIYEQVAEMIKKEIILQYDSTDKKIKSIRTTARELNINPNTVQKAYRLLEANGYIYSIKGKGYFIKKYHVKHSEEIEELRTIINSLMKVGLSKQEILYQVKIILK